MQVAENEPPSSPRRRPELEFTAACRQLREALRALSPSAHPADATLEREITLGKLRPFGKAWVCYFLAATGPSARRSSRA